MDYATIPPKETVDRTVVGLTERGFLPIVVETGIEALAKIKELIPSNATVMNGASTTLNEIGFVDYLKAGQHGWNNLHEPIVNEKDPAKVAQLRKQALLADYYLGSVHAMTKDGQMIIASNTGSQLPHIAFSSANLILVVSTNKITENLDAAFKRLNDYVVPLEDVRLMEQYGSHTYVSKTLIYSKEQAYLGRKVHIILVNEKLGF